MMIFERLGLNLIEPKVISVVGAGGKTSLIRQLSKELKSLDKKVLSTTTTQVFIPNNVDYFILKKIGEDFKPKEGTITSFASHIKNEKLIGSLNEVDEIIIRNIFDYVLIEADGSKGKPLKAPAEHEPVITSLTSITIGVIGLDSIGQILNESNFHRAELISKLISKEIGQPLDIEDVINLLLHNDGTFKDSVGRKILVLNKADSIERIKKGKYIRNKLLDRDIDILICNIDTKEFY